MEEKKTALVLGGTGGIGKELGRLLAANNITTIIVGRNKQKTEAVSKDIGATDFVLADLSLQSNVRHVADEVLSKYKRLDYLVLSAGGMKTEKKLTSEGVETSLALNYLSRFLLTSLLKDRLAESGGRVLNVARAGLNCDVFFDDPNFDLESFTMFKCHHQFQQLNDVFMVEAQRRWGNLGKGIQFHSSVPGLVDTGIVRDFRGLFGFFYNTLLRPIKKSPTSTAACLLPLLLGPAGAEGGRLWSGGIVWNHLSEITPANHVVDLEYGEKCWKLSESLLIPFPVRPESKPSFRYGLSS